MEIDLVAISIFINNYRRLDMKRKTNFYIMFVLIVALSLLPVAVSSAETSNLSLTDVIIEKNGAKYNIDVQLYRQMQGVNHPFILDGNDQVIKPSHVIASNGLIYDVLTYRQARNASADSSIASALNILNANTSHAVNVISEKITVENLNEQKVFEVISIK
jgi:membrane-associated PAP2 superfamily phosphatase